MTDAPSNVVEFSVSELSFALKRTVETNFDHVRVRGEVSGFRGQHGNGHCYFTLKDETACINAVIWRTDWQKLRFKPEEGLEMVATGRLTTFPRQSKYQIVVDSLEPAGAGALMVLLEERRRTLAAEGLFDEARKRPLPFLPRVIGVVTSPTGAVIRDILHRLRDRFPAHVLLWPVRVQGDGAAQEVAAALAGLNALGPGGPMPRPELIIVARGGGSIEDLWAFNEEAVVRAVAASAIPVISAVGHETDWTLCDHAADMRAPTPTGAAEMAVPVRAELSAQIAGLAGRHELAMARHVTGRRREVTLAARGLPALADLLALPRQRLDEAAGRLTRSLVAATRIKRRGFDGLAGRLRPELLARARLRQGERLGECVARAEGAMGRYLQQRHRSLAHAGRLLGSLSYTSVLARGFALVRDEADRILSSASAVNPGVRLQIEMKDGRVGATAEGQAAPRRRPGARSSTPEDQGALF
ncbi:MAG TPA: exodeoxyribonuclease VII large subunit [Afifellaceae bacterium]|nr:exodeoxyribonuclease VII large subunit [Afifellaceae bacterium]